MRFVAVVLVSDIAVLQHKQEFSFGYMQMALIFLPTLVLLPAVSLIATLMPFSSLPFISAGNYFFVEFMLLLIVECVAFGFNRNINGQSIRKSLRRGSK